MKYRECGTAGPNGPAMHTSMDDVRLLRSTPQGRSIIEACRTLGYDGWLDDSHELGCIVPKDEILEKGRKTVPGRIPVIRRIQLIPDKELKSRPIAIFDYLSQCVLRPLHFQQSTILKSIDEDYTFNQDGYRSVIDQYFKEPWDKRSKCISIDLHTATDRFPLKLQTFVMECLFRSKEKAAA